MKNLLLILISIILLLSSCARMSNEVPEDDEMVEFIEIKIQSDSTLLNQDPIIYHYNIHDYIANSKGEIVAVYNMNTNNKILGTFLFGLIFGAIFCGFIMGIINS